jgi:hypothetical protein
MSLVFSTKLQFTPSDKLIMLELCDHANDLGEGIWPGMQYIMDRTSMCRSAVRETLWHLDKIGVIRTVEEATVTTSTKRSINVSLLRELVDCGNRGSTHPNVAQANALLSERRARRNKKDDDDDDQSPECIHPNDQKIIDDSGGGTLRTPGVVRSEHQGWYAQNTRVLRSEHQGGALRTPESLINPYLNINNPGEDAQQEQEQDHAQVSCDAWQFVADQLATEMRRGDYDRFVKPLKITVSGGRVRLTAPDDERRRWVQDHLTTKISRLLSAAAGQDLAIEVLCQTT